MYNENPLQKIARITADNIKKTHDIIVREWEKYVMEIKNGTRDKNGKLVSIVREEEIDA